MLGSSKWNEIYNEKDEHFDLGLDRSRDRKFLMVESEAKNTSEVRYLRADRPMDPLALFLPRKDGHRYYVDHREGLFYIRTNKNGRNFSVMTAPAGDPAEKNWKVFLPHRDNTRIQNIDLFKDFAVAVEKGEALDHLRIHNFKTGAWKEISYAEPVYPVSPGGSPDYESHTYRYNYQSLVTPSSVFD